MILKHGPIITGGAGVEILQAASCYGNWDKLRPDGPLGSNADFRDFTYLLILHRAHRFDICVIINFFGLLEEH